MTTSILILVLAGGAIGGIAVGHGGLVSRVLSGVLAASITAFVVLAVWAAIGSALAISDYEAKQDRARAFVRSSRIEGLRRAANDFEVPLSEVRDAWIAAEVPVLGGVVRWLAWDSGTEPAWMPGQPVPWTPAYVTDSLGRTACARAANQLGIAEEPCGEDIHGRYRTTLTIPRGSDMNGRILISERWVLPNGRILWGATEPEADRQGAELATVVKYDVRVPED